MIGAFRGQLMVLVCLWIVMVNCGMASSNAQPSPDRVATFTASLDGAAYNDCQRLRDDIAHYLMTGEPSNMDDTYLSERSSILRQPAGVRDAYARRYINGVVALCDQQERARNVAATFKTSCEQLGGLIARTGGTGGYGYELIDYNAGACLVDYPVNGHDALYPLPLAVDGSFDQTKYAANRDGCRDSEFSFHTDTGVCAYKGP
jgi:hypothetical protein